MANSVSNIRTEEERGLQQVSLLPTCQGLPPGQDWHFWQQHITRDEV